MYASVIARIKSMYNTFGASSKKLADFILKKFFLIIYSEAVIHNHSFFTK